MRKRFKDKSFQRKKRLKRLNGQFPIGQLVEVVDECVLGTVFDINEQGLICVRFFDENLLKVNGYDLSLPLTIGKCYGSSELKKVRILN